MNSGDCPQTACYSLSFTSRRVFRQNDRNVSADSNYHANELIHPLSVTPIGAKLPGNITENPRPPFLLAYRASNSGTTKRGTAP
ncbi:hypothetical protein KVMX100_120855 [Klebsiella variicola]|nr:hypothetical protein KVMX100_120855 [Klebsiella variicola]